MKRAVAMGAFALLLAGTASAQELRTALAPDTVTPGGVFRAAIRVIVPRGAEVTFPDSLPVPDDVEAASSRAVTRDSLDADTDAVTAVYGLTAWRPGPILLPAAEVRAVIDGEDALLAAQFPPLTVLSVLPADTAGIEPQPPRDVLGPNRALLPLLLLAALVLAALAAGYWAWRKRRRPVAARESGAPPRDRALAELDRILRSGLLERGEYKVFCSAVTEVLRSYLAEIDPAWSPDLTTTELAGAIRGGAARHSGPEPEGIPGQASKEQAPGHSAPAVLPILGAADVIKFTGTPGTAAGADSIWTGARDWVASFDAGFRRAA